MAVAVEIGVDDARIGLWKMMEDECPCIGVALFQCEQMIAGKANQDFIDIVLPIFSTDQNTAKRKGEQNYQHRTRQACLRQITPLIYIHIPWANTRCRAPPVQFNSPSYLGGCGSY